MKAAVLYEANTAAADRGPRAAGTAGGRGARARQGRGRLPQRLAHHERRLAAAAAHGPRARGRGHRRGSRRRAWPTSSPATTSSSPSGRSAGAASTARSAAPSSATGTSPSRWAMLDGTHRLTHKGQNINQMARIGTFSESVVCPSEMLVPIRKEMPWPQAALVGCCVPTGVGAVTSCAKVEAGASVLVIGCGGVGLNVVQGARLAGAGMIVACDLLDSKLGYAKEFGATHTFNGKQDNIVERVRELTQRARRGLRLRRHRRRADHAPDPRRDPPRRRRRHRRHGGHGRARARSRPTSWRSRRRRSRAPCTARCGPRSTSRASSTSTSTAGSSSTSSSAARTRLDEINDGFTAMRTGQVARGVVVFN